MLFDTYWEKEIEETENVDMISNMMWEKSMHVQLFLKIK